MSSAIRHRSGSSSGSGSGRQARTYLDTGAQLNKPARRPLAKRVGTRKQLRRAVRDALAEARAQRKVNPWEPERVAGRDRVRQLLSQTVRGLGQELRADAIARCGHARVAFWALDDRRVVVDTHGLCPSLVTECGHRLCPTCAGRASGRNRRRLQERIEVAEAFSASCDVGPHPLPWSPAHASAGAATWAQVKQDDAAREMLAGIYGEDFRRAAAGGAWRFSVGIVEDHRGAVARHAVEARHHGGGEACGLAYGPSSLPAPVEPVEPGAAEVARPYVAAVARSSTGRALRKDVKGFLQALARQEAAWLLDRADSESWRAKRKRLAAAATAAAALSASWAPPPDAISPETPPGDLLPAMVAARDRVEWELCDAGAALAELPPAVLYGRDVVRWASTVARAESGERKARDTLTRVAQSAWARFVAWSRRALSKWAASTAKAAAKEERAWVKASADARAKAAACKLWRTADVRFVTLTQPARRGESARDAVARLRKSLALFVRRSVWRRSVSGGVVRVEVERSTPETRAAKAAGLRVQSTDLHAAGLIGAAAAKSAEADRLHVRRSSSRHWHAHAHMAVCTGFLDRAAWLAKWQECSDGAGPLSVAVEMPAREDIRGAVAEVTKYCVKPMGIDKLSRAEVGELVGALSGARTLRTLGALRGVVLVEERADVEEVAEGANNGATLSEALADLSKPVGCVTVDGGPVVVYADTIVWRDDAEAQEFRRVALYAAWALRERQKRMARRGAVVVDVPET